MAKIAVRKSSIHGAGVFAEQRIRRGQRIGRFEGTPTDRDGTYVLWVLDEDDCFRGLEGTGPLRFLNHSADPNAEFQADELYALRTIREGDEITCHYGDAWEDDGDAREDEGAPRDVAPSGLEPVRAVGELWGGEPRVQAAAGARARRGRGSTDPGAGALPNLTREVK